MADQSSLPSLTDFRGSLSSARYEDSRTRPEVKCESAEAFEAIRDHVLNLYEGVEAQHSFLERGGMTVDCIPIEQQPSIETSGGRVLDPPPEPPGPPETYSMSPDPTERYREAPEPHLHPDYRDRLGNQMWCPPGTIPMVRITLEQLWSVRSLDALLRGGRPGGPGPKRYAAASERVDNLGGSSYINVWQPQVFAPQNSDSQQWYATPPDPFVTTQTVECGWRVAAPGQPPFDGSPRLFVFYTPDNYTTGCYNLMCPGGFVQTSPTFVLGATLPVSQSGGNQAEVQMGFFLTGGAWWFNVAGEWVGYYPASLFQGGRLAASAGSVGFGGETSGVGAFPSMGSGAFPLAGFGRAAYQRSVFVTPVGGEARTANLTPGQQFPSCYNIVIANNSPTTWGTHFYFGGPGGVGC